MTVNELMQYRRAVPFRPFVLVLKDGRRLDITEPTAIGRNSAFTRIAVAGKYSAEGFDIGVVSHVEALETTAITSARGEI